MHPDDQYQQGRDQMDALRADMLTTARTLILAVRDTGLDDGDSGWSVLTRAVGLVDDERMAITRELIPELKAPVSDAEYVTAFEVPSAAADVSF